MSCRSYATIICHNFIKLWIFPQDYNKQFSTDSKSLKNLLIHIYLTGWQLSTANTYQHFFGGGLGYMIHGSGYHHSVGRPGLQVPSDRPRGINPGVGVATPRFWGGESWGSRTHREILLYLYYTLYHGEST